MDDLEIIDWEETAARRLLSADSYEERCRIYSEIYDEDNAFWLARHGREGISGTCARNRALLQYACAGEGPVLDVGGGTGIAGDALSPERLYVTCDASRVVQSEHSRGDRRAGVLGCATDLPFDRGSFETVLALDVLEHLHRDDIHRCLAECRRILCPGGKLLIATPHRLSGPWDARGSHPDQHHRAGLHLNELTVSTMLRDLRHHGFRSRGFVVQEYRRTMWQLAPLALWAGLLEAAAGFTPRRFRARLCRLAVVLAVAR